MAVSELPSNPTAVWTVRASEKEDHDKYIVVSFLNATIVLSIGETVEEVTDSGFLATTSTLSVSLLGDDSLLQVHPGGIRRIRSDRRINEFTPPNKGVISKVAVNQRQVAIALTDNSIIYFELDAANQLEERAKPEIAGQVAALDLAQIGAGRSRSKFLVVGSFETSWIVRVLSLEPGNFMQVLSRQALPDRPESLCLIEIATGTSANDGGATTLFLFAGLANGVLMRIGVDPVSGQLAPDFRTRFLGAKPVKLFKVLVQGQPAVLALSSRSWLCYNYQGRYHITPMSYETLEYAATFASEQCPEGLVSVAGNTLRILTVERFGEIFNQQSMKLAYTPRKSVCTGIQSEI
jgi:splicing factor 3B subunit 3